MGIPGSKHWRGEGLRPVTESAVRGIPLLQKKTRKNGAPGSPQVAAKIAAEVQQQKSQHCPRHCPKRRTPENVLPPHGSHFGATPRSRIIKNTVLKYSIVVPLHNEQENVTDLYARLKSVMEASGEAFEMVRGEYIIAMDGDLQHDPADIPLFLEKIAEGYDIVSGWRKNRVDNFWLRRFPSRCANWLMAKLSGVDIHDFGTTFKAYRREILGQVPLYGELHRFIPALASWHGASIVEVPIKNVNRERGASHYGISRTFRVFFDLITIRFLLKYLSRPLHFFGTVGMFSIMAGCGISGWLILQKLLHKADVMYQHGPLVPRILSIASCGRRAKRARSRSDCRGETSSDDCLW